MDLLGWKSSGKTMSDWCARGPGPASSSHSAGVCHTTGISLCPTLRLAQSVPFGLFF